ncbi:putative F420-dependent oxidoreductase [Nakamurella sp. UYEF19]|uniref:LLM class F420-dependent oxidoreductase n=1 Tax=Nakamurella sp. UYEF19 TaxID=1756392 RepID=UPI0033981DFA
MSNIRNVDLTALRTRLGRVGVWLGALESLPARAARDAAGQIEAMGYPTLWIAENRKEAFAQASILLSASEHLTVATGIANVWAREPDTAVSGANTLGEAFPDRFVLGLGIGHAKFVERYDKPLATMRTYLDRMHESADAGGSPVNPVPWLVAALRPKMLELAAARTQGSHPYFVPVEHTAFAREALGPAPVLAPEVAVVLDPDPSTARATARAYMKMYLDLPNYTGNLLTFGFTEDDLSDGGSDRLVDAIVPWGDVETIRSRVHEHLDAGADHVCIQPLTGGPGVGLRELQKLAPALLG